MPVPRPLRLRHIVGRALGIVLLANVVFLALTIIAPGDARVVADRVRTAFETGELGLADYLPFDARRGWHQYNDCNVLQMLSNADSSRLRRALTPAVYYAGPDFGAACPVLYGLVVGHVDRRTLFSLRYTQYWHGYNVPTALALRVIELRTLRRVLQGAMWLAIVALAVASCRSGAYTRRAALAIAMAAAVVWAVPYFAPGITHGPGDALVLLALAGLVAWRRLSIDFGAIVPYAAVFGAVVAFFEMLTGQLPIAAAWLATMTLSVARDAEGPEGRRAGRLAIAAVISFGLGAVVTIAAKQVLALALIGPDAGARFVTKIRHYSAIPEADGPWPGILLPFRQLAEWAGMLTYGSEAAARVLTPALIVTWLGAACRTWSRRGGGERGDVLGILAAALVPVAWVLVLPRHTYIHAPFMVRMLVVPMSLVALAWVWPTGAGVGAAARPTQEGLLTVDSVHSPREDCAPTRES